MVGDSYVEVPPDSTGKRLRTYEVVVSSTTVHEEVVVIADQSGNLITPLTSGDIVTLPSGQPVGISGETIHIASGDVVINVSGLSITINEPTDILYFPLAVGSLSGGITFDSCAVMEMTIRSMPGNGSLWIGSQGVNSGQGFLVLAGEEKTLKVNNMNKVWMYMEVSGERIMGLGEF